MRNAVIRIAALLFVGGLVGGCAASETCPKTPADAPVEHITVRSPGSFQQVALQGTRMFGPDFDIARCNNAYRGTAVKRTVDLTVQPDVIEGMIGTGRTNLHINMLPDGFQLKGLYAGKLGDLTLRRDRLDGQLGGRVFHLQSTGAGPAAPAAPGEPTLANDASKGGTEQGQEVAMGGSSGGGGPKGVVNGPTGIELPASFTALPPQHQAAVLAIFLGR